MAFKGVFTWVPEATDYGEVLRGKYRVVNFIGDKASVRIQVHLEKKIWCTENGSKESWRAVMLSVWPATKVTPEQVQHFLPTLCPVVSGDTEWGNVTMIKDRVLENYAFEESFI